MHINHTFKIQLKQVNNFNETLTDVDSELVGNCGNVSLCILDLVSGAYLQGPRRSSYVGDIFLIE